MSDKPKEPEILNPRYAGATPEMVARALLRHDPRGDDGEAEDKAPNLTEQDDVRPRI